MISTLFVVDVEVELHNNSLYGQIEHFRIVHEVFLLPNACLLLRNLTIQPNNI